MDKLTTSEINNALTDVRSAYRLLALYQQRILDTVKYICNAYSLPCNSGWSKFSGTASKNRMVDIDKISWEWLALYLYEFNLGGKEINTDKYHFKIVHQADTGYYDATADKKMNKINVDQYGDASMASTRLFFVLSKNANGCPMQNILNKNLKTRDNKTIKEGNWLAVPYSVDNFINQAATDKVLEAFNQVCKDYFGVEIMKELETKV
jgi:hypothetical protein